MKTKEIPLEEGKYYHIYNRGNNRGNLFYNTGNYEYFLRKYDDYLSEFIDTYAFCLLPNHFHMLVRVKDEVDMNPSRVLNSGRVLNYSRFLSLKFSHFFNTYAQAINKQEGRTGSLFQKNYKRIEVTNTNYLANLVFYIHANPQQHGIIDDFRMYPWSSYDRILKSKPSKLKKEEVLEWFDDRENYIYCHTRKANIENIKKLIMED